MFQEYDTAIYLSSDGLYAPDGVLLEKSLDLDCGFTPAMCVSNTHFAVAINGFYFWVMIELNFSSSARPSEALFFRPPQPR